MAQEADLKMENNNKSSDCKKAQSLGEELFLVHLRRDARTERQGDDYDYGNPRKHGRIGEELWEIHLKRSRGISQKEEDHDSKEDLDGVSNKGQGASDGSESKDNEGTQEGE